jgi:hypothetical protein
MSWNTVTRSTIKVTELRNYGKRWYATYVDGNFSTTAPTCFPGTMALEEVIKAIRQRSPDVEVAQ